MHELGLLMSVVDAVSSAAHDAGDPRVETVALRVGAQSGAVAEALYGSWPIAVADTALQGARLEVEEVEASVWCPACGADRVIDEFYAWRCPVCDTPTGVMTHGREFEVAWVEWDQDSHSSTTDAAS